MGKLPIIPGYKIKKKLGQGGMASVFLCVQEKLNRLVAIKLLENRVDTTDMRIAVIDRSGIMTEHLVEAAEKRNATEMFDQESGKKIRGTLAAVFLIGTLMAIISLVIIGRFGYKELHLSVISFPAMILGFYLSGKTAKYLDRGFLRPAVLIISTLSAIVVIIKSLS